jgi:methionine-rich copper-binding protein CopC
MFPTIASMGAVVQSTLVVAGWLATALTRELSQAAVATMSAAPDQEVLQLADQLTAAVAMLTSAATMLIAPTAVLVAWCVFLRPSGRAAAHFGRDVVAGSEEVPIRAANPTGEVVFAVNTVASRRAAPSPTLPPLLSPRNAGVALIGLGILMLLFAGVDRLRARPAYVASTPEAGAQIASGPPVIRVTFDHALDSASTLSVVYLPPEPRLDDISRDVPASSRLASTDVDRRTLEAIPERIGRGLYLVRWVAYPESGGVTRHGSFTFGVGLPVPPDRRGMIYTLSERDSGNRGRRSTVAGGLLLLAIGALAWARP